jgi:hypothetical protein
MNRLKTRFIKTLVRSSELIWVIGLVFAFFCIFMVLLDTVFPSGTHLRQLMDRGVHSGTYRSGHEAWRKLLLLHQGRETDLTDTDNVAAVLARVHHRVKSKRAESVAWISASEGMPLFDRDAVQTFNRSHARIQFNRENYLDIRENSLVIIKRLEQDILFKEQRILLVVVDGELRGLVAKNDEKPAHIEITTPNALARIRTRHLQDDQAEFKISVNPDQSSTIAVYHGEAEIIGNGKKVKLQSNQFSNVLPGQSPSEPEALPAPVDLTSPMDSTLYTYRSLLPKVRFGWNPREEVQEYRLILARDPDFQDIVYEDRLKRKTFAHGNLKQGTFYWRVNGIKNGLDGAFSETRSFHIVQDAEPPGLHVIFPPGTVFDHRYHLTGKTEPGARVFVMGEPVQTTENGEFDFNLKLQPGINVVVVEAMDKAGNVKYLSQLVNRKP